VIKPSFTDQCLKHYLRTIASVEPEEIIPSPNQPFENETK